MHAENLKTIDNIHWRSPKGRKFMVKEIFFKNLGNVILTERYICEPARFLVHFSVPPEFQTAEFFPYPCVNATSLPIGLLGQTRE